MDDKRAGAVIAEDEHVARLALRRLVEETGWMEIVGEAVDGRSAVSMIDRLRPAVLFLDVQLPEMSGLEALERMRHRPLVVFTTAFDRFAVKAFEVEAVDYLVKPFGRRRFRETMERIRKRLWDEASEGKERLYARLGSRVVPIDIRDVSHFEAEGDYVRAYAGEHSFLISESMTLLEQRLNESFIRIHRRHIVNVDAIRAIDRRDERRMAVSLNDGTTVVSSRAGTARLRKLTR